jgi:anti-sigma factor RsiW
MSILSLWKSRTATEHQRVRETLSDYIDGRLSKDEAASIEAHLTACADCVNELATLRWTVGLLQQVPTVPTPRAFTLTVPMPKQRVVAPARQPVYGTLRVATAVAAMLLVIVFAIDLAVTTTMRPATVAKQPVSTPAAASLAETQQATRLTTDREGRGPLPAPTEPSVVLMAAPTATPHPESVEGPQVVAAAPPAPTVQPSPPLDVLQEAPQHQAVLVLLAVVIGLGAATLIVGRRR